MAARFVGWLGRSLPGSMRATNWISEVTQRVLARALGIRHETLSRAVRKMRLEGALAPGRGIRVADVAVLRALGGQLDPLCGYRRPNRRVVDPDQHAEARVGARWLRGLRGEVPAKL